MPFIRDLLVIVDDSDKESSITSTRSEKPGSSASKSASASVHPFFMAPAARAAARLSHQISESNALNRAIRINLLSEDEDSSNSGCSGSSKCVDQGPSSSSSSSSFFQKRTKISAGNHEGKRIARLKRISSADPPPFPLEFQLPKPLIQPFEASNYIYYTNESKCNLIELPQSKQSNTSIPVAKIIKESCSNIDRPALNRLLNHSNQKQQSTKDLFTEIYNEIVDHFNPILWVLTGPSGVGKTGLIESIAESANLRLITIDSTQIPRNGKTFETLLTTLSHSTKSLQFFNPSAAKASQRERVAILFDEVEIAFESDRGYWTALSAFLQSPSSRNVPVFITSNTDESFLGSIIKFPEHVRFSAIERVDYDKRKEGIHNDFISRLHRIDTSLEYEQLAMTTGYYCSSEVEVNETGNLSKLVNEILRWNNVIKSITPSINDPFAYAESASFSDLLLSTKDRIPVKMNLDYYDNISCEFFDDDDGTNVDTGSTLLYSIVPEIYDNEPVVDLVCIVNECIGRSIKAFTDELLGGNDFDFHDKSAFWRDMSKRLSRRFFDYTKCIQPVCIWTRELTFHVIFMERDNDDGEEVVGQMSRRRRRRRRAYYRYIGDELLNEILDNNSNINSNKL